MPVPRRTVTETLRQRLADTVWADVEVGQRTGAPPTVVLHPLPGGIPGRMLADTGAHGVMTYQLTCVGGTGPAGRNQAEHLADEAIVALTGGWRDGPVESVTLDGWPDSRPDDDEQPSLWISTPIVLVAARQES